MAPRQSKTRTRAEVGFLLHLEEQGVSDDTSSKKIQRGVYLSVLGGGSIRGSSSIGGGGELDRGVIHVHSLACK